MAESVPQPVAWSARERDAPLVCLFDGAPFGVIDTRRSPVGLAAISFDLQWVAMPGGRVRPGQRRKWPG